MKKLPLTYSEFVLRRLHSLTGLVPLTFFVFFHLYANSYSTRGAAAFDALVANLRGIPYLLAVEWGALFAPFLFHMFYGLWIIYTARHNPVTQSHQRNYAYIAQRVTAMILFTFILYHVISIRFIDAHGRDDVYQVMRERFSNPAAYWAYVIGIAATAFHMANGVCTFAMTWGLTIGRKAQRGLAFAMTGAGVLLFVMGIASMNGFLKDVKPEHPHKAAGKVDVASAVSRH